MRKRPKQADTDTITCGECNDATLEPKYGTIKEKAHFCVWCPVDGLLKMKKWPCFHGRKHDRL